jgi:hypothetical protein
MGLNSAARRAAGLHGLALPAALHRRLAAGASVTHPFSFTLVRTDPGADSEVMASGGERPGPGAEWRVEGQTRYRPRGTDVLHVDRRLPTGERGGSPPPEAFRDERVSLPVLRIEVELSAVLEPLHERLGPRRERRDRLTWLVLDHPEEPWIVSVEGRIESRQGDPADPGLQEVFHSRALFRIEEPLAALDGIQATP